jgi:hypothetical protein
MAIKPKFGYYPSNFELELFCNKYKLKESKVVEFLSIFSQPIKRKKVSERHRLNAEILKNSIGKDYNKIIKALIMDDVLVHTDGWVKDIKSNEFKLTSKYQNCSDFIEFQLSDETPETLRLVNEKRKEARYLAELKIPKLKRKAPKPYRVFKDDYRYLIEWLRDSRLTFNQTRAFEILESTGFQNSTKKKERNKYKYYKVSIQSFRPDNIYMSCDYNDRFYSNLTSLPKIFRCCLSFNGEPLVGYDISNTHPVLLSNLCDTFFLKKLVKSKAIEVNPEQLNKFLALVDSNPTDLQDYNKLASAGHLYRQFNSWLPQIPIGTIKKKFLSLINDEYQNYNDEILLIRRTLFKHFPTIYGLLELMKSVNYKYISSVLMSMEAANFAVKFPHEFYYKLESDKIDAFGTHPFPLYTVHDCFVTNESNKDMLKKYLNWYFKESMGMQIPIKQQKWN